MRASGFRRALAMTLVVAALGCAQEPPRQPPPLETVDVAPPPDARASLAHEPVAAPVEKDAQFSGVLPAGFPADIPLPRPSSLVDVELGGDGIAIVLASPSSPNELGPVYGRLLRAAGWQPEGPSVAGGWRKGVRKLRVELVDARPGSRLRVELASPT